MDYNAYGRQLTDEQILKDQHREFVGSFWDEIGILQFEFLVKNGLKPHHQVLDLGCGALRGGVHIIKYLNKHCYTGLDANSSLLRAAKKELKKYDLENKYPDLIHEQNFKIEKKNDGFDFVLSISLFTHLPIHLIEVCLKSVVSILAEKGFFYSSFFEVADENLCGPILHNPGNIHTYKQNDPFHQSRSQIQKIANNVGMEMKYLGNWNHPRGQRMLQFCKLALKK
jgi:cyclopropane fatty-acyl-phospholipid synthase-like methyltransferase